MWMGGHPYRGPVTHSRGEDRNAYRYQITATLSVYRAGCGVLQIIL